MAALKGDRVLKRLKRAGAPSSIGWSPIVDSKGNTALKLIADLD
jgi:hypothetical protein